MALFKRNDPGKEKLDQGCYFVGYAVSDVGRVRSNNEDNYVIDTYMNRSNGDYSERCLSAPECSRAGWHFAGVFDGMGGGEKGEVAAHETAVIFLETFRNLGIHATTDQIDQGIRNAFLQANNRIIDLQQESRVFGTTGTVVATDGRSFKVYHLGDSRAYFMRNGELFQLTRDQTLAQMKIDAGLYQPDDPQVEVDKHKLTEYIGRDWTRENIRPLEGQWIPVTRNDRILLCSDGLYDMCPDFRIADILGSGNNVSKVAQGLVRSALDQGGEDNVTCIVVIFF